MMTSSNRNISALLALCEGILRLLVDSPHKGQWRAALIFSLIYAWTNGWANNRNASDLRRHSVRYDVTLMSRCRIKRQKNILTLNFHLPAWYVYITWREPILVIIVPADDLAPNNSGSSQVFFEVALDINDSISILWTGWLHTNFPLEIPGPLHWRHNDHNGVSNHQPHGCLLNRLFRHRSKKTSKLRVIGLCVGNSPGPVNSPHKGPVTRKMFPFDDVIMILGVG